MKVPAGSSYYSQSLQVLFKIEDRFKNPGSLSIVKMKHLDDDNGIEDVHIESIEEIIPPIGLLERYKRGKEETATVKKGRVGIRNILEGKDSRRVLIAGPCSIHDYDEAIEYAEKLKKLSDKVEDQFHIVMRTYFEKPRTGPAWRGLISDPDMDGNFDMIKGLDISRRLLKYINGLGLPAATEFVDPTVPQYLSDLISWNAIGARTTQSQLYSQMATGLSMPVGFKNSLSGSISDPINAMAKCIERSAFLGTSKYGHPSIVRTTGNPECHIVLRGADDGPNYQAEQVREFQELLAKKGLQRKIMIDCSHGNSGKDYRKQPTVFEDVIDQVINGNSDILGIMLESNLFEGNQKIPDDLRGFDRSTLKYGVSVTDSCIGWQTTEEIIMTAYEKLKLVR